MASMEGAIFQVFLYGLLSVPSHQFFVPNCTVTVSPNDMCNVSCCGMDLTTVPAVLPIHVKELSISYNAISEVKLTDFRNVSSLRALDMSHNNISRIDDGTFQELIYLRELYMSSNRLKHVTKGCLEGLVSLTMLRFDENKIEQIDPSAFDSLHNLTHVNLASNRLTHMESVKTILHLPNLFELKIEFNKITSFVSHDLSSTPLQLQRLDLSYNPLKTFNITENVLPHLRYLDISYCGPMQCIVVGEPFLGSVQTLNVCGLLASEDATAALVQTFNSSLKNLQVGVLNSPHFEDFLERTCSQVQNLRLVQPRIPVLSDGFFKSCHQLQGIYFTDSTTSEISPRAFHGLNQLQRLRVGYTKITKFNNITHVLPTLSQLDFSNNNIKQVTCSDFSNLTHLEKLNLNHNHINMMSNCIFQNLPNLQVLLLGSNELLNVSNVFNGHLPKLVFLDLQGNKISRLEEGTFNGLDALQRLNMYQNQIQKISENAFEGLHNLKELVLTRNSLSHITFNFPGVFKGMENLEELNLNDNYIVFDTQPFDDPPFAMLKSLKKLFFADQRTGGNMINNLPCNLLKGLISLTSFYGSNLNIQYLHHETFSYTPKLQYLDLSKNTFGYMDNSLSPRVFHPILALSALNLEQCYLKSLNFVIGANLSQLRDLQIQNNQLQVINQTIMESLPNLTNVDLQNNKFICDCTNAWLLHWAINSAQTQVIYFNKYQCSYPLAAQGQYLEDLKTSSCTLNLEFIYFVGSSSLVIVTLLVSFMYDFVRFQLVYAYYLLLAYLYDSKRQRRQRQHGFLYDAFVSYNSHDELWVLQELLPHLEIKQGWRLCLHHRDFEPGKPIIDNIVDGIYSSRKTICVVTRNYLRSEWCSKEIQVASFRLFDENNDVLILVLLEDIPAQQLSPYHRMRKLVKKQTYLCWPKHGEDKRIFWEKLRMALNAKKEDNHILLGRAEGSVMKCTT